MVFCPALDFGETGALGKESEENEGEEGVEGMRLFTFGAGIRNFFQTADEEFKRRKVEHASPL